MVEEIVANVSRRGVERFAAADPPPQVDAWINLYRRHERAFRAAVIEKSLKSIEACLHTDPSLSWPSIHSLAIELYDALQLMELGDSDE